MEKGQQVIGATLWLTLCSSCAVHVHGISSVHLNPARLQSVEAFHEHASFEEVKGGTGSNPTLAQARDRDRTGARISWDHRGVRSYLQLYSVEWPDGGDPENRFEGFGFGCGFRGTPVVSHASGGVDWILPWQAGLNFESAENTAGNPSGGTLNPLEYDMQLGVGIDWRGLRPTVGLAFSRLVGTFHPDGGHSSDDDGRIRGTNLGAYADLAFKPRGSNVYGKLRYQRGDYDSFTVGIGVAF